MARGRKAREAERKAHNIGLREEQERLSDPEKRPPHHEPEPDGGTPPDANVPNNDIARLENPPQVDGPRERIIREAEVPKD